MKTPRFSGPFKWTALRQQLLSLREDVQSIEKIAGRHVTIDEHRGEGKVINVASDASRRPTSGGGGGAATGACCAGTDCSIQTESDCIGMGGTYQGDDTTCDPNPCLTTPPSCYGTVTATICFQWYPFGWPPDVDCIVTVGETAVIAIDSIYCPINYATTGGKFGFNGNLTSASISGEDCGSTSLGTSAFASTTDLYWDAAALEWSISVKIVFPGIPATFTYGYVTVAGADLTAAGSIVMSSQDCPDTYSGSGDLPPNPAASISIAFAL